MDAQQVFTFGQQGLHLLLMVSAPILLTVLAVGLLASAGLNILFGFATSVYFMIFVWACNGYVQALGWPPTMRVAANWFNITHRGRAIGIIGTGYQTSRRHPSR